MKELGDKGGTCPLALGTATWRFGEPSGPYLCFPMFKGQNRMACPPKWAWQHCPLMCRKAWLFPGSSTFTSPSFSPSLFFSLSPGSSGSEVWGQQQSPGREKRQAPLPMQFTYCFHTRTHMVTLGSPPNGGLNNHANSLTCMMLNRRQAFTLQ